MLTRITKSLVKRQVRLFGATHVKQSLNFQFKVNLDNSKEYIDTSNREYSSLFLMEAVEDEHHHEEHHDDEHHEGPFDYIERSFKDDWIWGLMNGEPYFVPYSEDKYCHEPHGYLLHSDPFDERDHFDIFYLKLYLGLIILFVFGVFYGTRRHRKNPSHAFFDGYLTTEEIEAEMKEIRVENELLRLKKEVLVEELNSL